MGLVESPVTMQHVIASTRFAAHSHMTHMLAWHAACKLDKLQGLQGLACAHMEHPVGWCKVLQPPKRVGGRALRKVFH